jgi:hypothetical protein
MRVPTLVEVDKMPEISNLLSACLFEINIAGLLASLLVGPPERERFLSSISQRGKVLMSLFELIEKIPGTSMKLGPMPVLYNSGMWSEGDVLGGYTGPHVNVRPTELAVSYIAAWKFKGVYSRLVKATIWYILSGRTFEEGFRYLIDLFESGFIIDTNEFIGAGVTLLEIYSKASDPYKAIKRLPIDKDPGTTEKMMHSIGVIIKKQEANNAKIREIFGVLLNITYEKLTTAKTIVSLGELVLAWAKWHGLVLLVQHIERAYKSNLNLAIADEAILSPLEEFRADVAPLRDILVTSPRYFPFTDLPETGKFPIPLFFGYLILLFMEYKKTFAENAVDKLLEDRFMPGYFRNILEFLDEKKMLYRTRILRGLTKWSIFQFILLFQSAASKILSLL